MSGLAKAKPDTAGPDVCVQRAGARDDTAAALAHTHEKEREKRETRFAGAGAASVADRLPVLPLHQHCGGEWQSGRVDLLALPGVWRDVESRSFPYHAEPLRVRPALEVMRRARPAGRTSSRRIS